MLSWWPSFWRSHHPHTSPCLLRVDTGANAVWHSHWWTDPWDGMYLHSTAVDGTKMWGVVDALEDGVPLWEALMVPWQPYRVQQWQMQSPLCGAAVQAGVTNCLGDSSGAKGLGTVVMKLVIRQQLQRKLTTYSALLDCKQQIKWVIPPTWHSGDCSWSTLLSFKPSHHPSTRDIYKL